MGSQVRALYRPPRRRGLHLFATTFFCFSKNASLSRSVATPLRRKDRSRRLGAFALRAAFSFSFLRCSLRSQKVKVKAILSDGALCAPSLISHFSFLILHCPFLAPPPRRELRSFCVGGVSFCSSVPRLRRVKGQGLLRTALVRDDVFLFLKKRAAPRSVAPVAVPAFFGARSARLKKPTAATRSPSFLRRRAPSCRTKAPLCKGGCHRR